jgi:hypothetical protein
VPIITCRTRVCATCRVTATDHAHAPTRLPQCHTASPPAGRGHEREIIDAYLLWGVKVCCIVVATGSTALHHAVLRTDAPVHNADDISIELRVVAGALQASDRRARRGRWGCPQVLTVVWHGPQARPDWVSPTGRRGASSWDHHFEHGELLRTVDRHVDALGAYDRCAHKGEEERTGQTELKKHKPTRTRMGVLSGSIGQCGSAHVHARQCGSAVACLAWGMGHGCAA